MTFSDIQNFVYFRTKTNSSSLGNTDLNLLVNVALDRVVSLINRADSKWQFDDSNYSDRPSGTFALVSGQQDYTLPTSHLTLDRAEILPNGASSSSDWKLLAQIDRTILKHQSLESYRSTDGEPREFDLIGRSFMLYPAPNYAQSESIRLWFTRSPLRFDYSDNKFTDDTGSSSSEPGFNSMFHDLVPLWASYNYAIANNQISANGFFAEIQKKEQELDKFYGNRNRDIRPRFTSSTNISVGAESGRITRGGNDSNK